MSYWTETTLGQICAQGGGNIQTGPFGSQLHASDYVDSGIPSVMPQNIGDNVIVEAGIARITEEDAERLGKYRLRTNDIVYSRRGDVERRALVRPDEDGWLCGTGCLKVGFGNSPIANPAFISYYLGTEESREWIVRHAVGATMLNLNTKILSAVPLTIPPLNEQQAIAEVLGALDDKIAANTKLAVAAEDMATALLAEFRPAVALGDIVDYRKNSTNPPTLDDSRVAQYSLPAFDQGQLPEESSPLDIKSSKFLIERPAVLVAKLNPRFPRIWNVARVPDIPALASTEFLVLEPLHSSTTVLWAVLSQPGFSASLESKVAGTSGSHQRVKPADLLATLVPDPRSIPTETQDSITSIGLRAGQTRRENEILAATRDALLPQLMSGKLRVKDAEALVSAAV